MLNYNPLLNWPAHLVGTNGRFTRPIWGQIMSSVKTEALCPLCIRGHHRQLDDSLVGQLTSTNGRFSRPIWGPIMSSAPLTEGGRRPRQSVSLIVARSTSCPQNAQENATEKSWISLRSHLIVNKVMFICWLNNCFKVYNVQRDVFQLI